MNRDISRLSGDINQLKESIQNLSKEQAHLAQSEEIKQIISAEISSNVRLVERVNNTVKQKFDKLGLDIDD